MPNTRRETTNLVDLGNNIPPFDSLVEYNIGALDSAVRPRPSCDSAVIEKFFFAFFVQIFWNLNLNIKLNLTTDLYFTEFCQ